MPKISVIIPVYNSEKYVGKCLDSLLEQTYDDIEVILIDDCSKDNSLNVINSYQEKYPDKIKVIQSCENKGAAKARNLGLDIATGEYIGFVDSDDFITKDYYEKLLTACMETGAQLSRTNRKLVFGGIELSFLGRKCHYQSASIINPKEDPRYLVNEPPCVTNKLFSRELIGDAKFPEGLKWEDYPFVVPLMVAANQVAAVPEKNYFYNIHLSSTTCSDARRLNQNMLDIFTCSDMVGESCLTAATPDNVKYLINYVQMQNCLQRLKEILNARMPLAEKQELLTLMSHLVQVKYGPWQEHEIYQEQKDKSLFHGVRMHMAESLLLPTNGLPQDEETVKQMIKTNLNRNIK